MHRFSMILVLLAALIATAAVRPQVTKSPAHNHAMSQIIDGAVHPELIPDLTAYRLWLVAVSVPPLPTENQSKRQLAQLATISLQDSDRDKLITILADFNTKYQAVIQRYNAEATVEMARGEKPDVASMRLQRDQLVRSAHDRIKVVLTSEGWSRLDAHIQNEKRRMKIHLEGDPQ